MREKGDSSLGYINYAIFGQVIKYNKDGQELCGSTAMIIPFISSFLKKLLNINLNEETPLSLSSHSASTYCQAEEKKQKIKLF